MSEPVHEEVGTLVRAEASRLLVEQIRICFWNILIVAVVFAVGDLIAFGTTLPVLHGLNLCLIALLVVGLRAVRLPQVEPHAVVLALLTVTAVYLCSAGAGILRHDATTTPLLAVVITLGIGAVFAWGIVPQLATVAIAASSMVWNIYAVNGRFGVMGHDTILTVAVAMALSVWMAHRRERFRFEAAEQNLARQRDAAQRASEERFAALVQHSSDIVVIQGADGVARYISPAVHRVLGYSPEELVGKDLFTDLHHPNDHAAMATLFESVARHPGLNASGELRIRHTTGSWVCLEATATNMLQHPQIHGVVVHARDITDRKRAEKEKDALLQVARDITGTLDLSEMLDRVQRRIVEVLPCDAVATYYWHPQERAVRMVAQYGLHADLLRATESFDIKRGMALVEQLSSARSIVINDIAEQGWIPTELFAGSGIAALAWTQLNVQGRPLGALIAFNTHSHRRFESSQVEVLEGIGGQVGVAIETAELHHAQQQEAEVSAALARVGRELISSLDQPALLAKLCQVTAQVLACDTSHTILWDATDDAYVPGAGYGYGVEEWEAIRVVKTPRPLLAGLLETLDRDEVMQAHLPDAPDDPLAAAAREFGFTRVLCMALRRGSTLIGFQVACRRGRHEPFSPTQLRIARGTTQLASLALENARLLSELAHASRLKSDFVATMSHELRTPLNIIVGYGDLLLESAFGALTEEQADTLRRMSRQAVELDNLINNTLDLSRLETRGHQLAAREFHLRELVAELDVETRDLQTKSGLRFDWQVPPDLPPLYTDPMKLKLILKNLITNAFKFSEHGSITVSVGLQDGGVELCVTDTGIGIAPGALPIIFEPFRQVDSSPTRSHGGVGLGLYIVRRFIEVLGGTVAVDSRVGEGSTFRVWIPRDIRDCATQAPPAAPH